MKEVYSRFGPLVQSVLRGSRLAWSWKIRRQERGKPLPLREAASCRGGRQEFGDPKNNKTLPFALIWRVGWNICGAHFMATKDKPLVGILMGSRSDWEVMEFCSKQLDELEVPHEALALSAHRTPDAVFEYCTTALSRGLEVIIAAAGGAAHLGGVIAAKTPLPVLAVPMESKSLHGMDSLLSMVQMPAGIPVGTLAIGKPGAINSALLAVSILANKYPRFRANYDRFRQNQTEKVLAGQVLR